MDDPGGVLWEPYTALPICQAPFMGGLHPGYLLPDGCHFGRGGAEQRMSSGYTVLEDPNAGWSSASGDWTNGLVGGQEANAAGLWECYPNYSILLY